MVMTVMIGEDEREKYISPTNLFTLLTTTALYLHENVEPDYSLASML